MTIQTNQKKITDYYKSTKKSTQTIQQSQVKIICGYNPETDDWHCMVCGISMGPHNPRQLCGKTYCPNEKLDF